MTAELGVPVELVDLRLPELQLGHVTHIDGATGCTVALLPEGTIASGEIRGGAPASRETALLDPDKTVGTVNAFVLSGGSAFGLATSDGVMRFCEERGVGFPTTAGPVPIVVGLSCFDLLTGDVRGRRPTPEDGYAAAVAASTNAAGTVPVGRVGAGTGTLVGAWLGVDEARPGGVGAASVERDGLVVGAVFAVNAIGDIDTGDDVLARMRDVDLPIGRRPSLENTTIGMVFTNARLTKLEAHLVAQSSHDGLARALIPAHTSVDGDAVLVAATGTLDRPVLCDHVRLMAAVAVDRAIRMVATFAI